MRLLTAQQSRSSAACYARDQKALKTITQPRLLETQFRPPQLQLWEFGPEDWHLVLRLPE